MARRIDGNTLAAALLVCAAVAAVFSPAFGFPFLNWDDQDVFARNAALSAPDFLRWAFTTTYMEHYQPLAWLVWGTLARTAGVTPFAVHTLNIVLHVACALLVFVLAQMVWADLNVGPYSAGKDSTDRRGRPLGRSNSMAALAALIFAIHPLRVETVAWASAMPYSLALALALLATIAWLDGRWLVSTVCFALSLLARPIALGLPFVFALASPKAGAYDRKSDLAPVRAGADDGRSLAPAKAGASDVKRSRARNSGTWGPASAGPETRWTWMLALAGLLLLSIAAATVESRARLTASFGEVSPGARATLAVTAPFRYLWATLVPLRLTPLDPIPLAPRANVPELAAGSIALIAVTFVLWRVRHSSPGALKLWLAYLALLVPALGLVPSGLQATADRYTYLPAVPLAIGFIGLTFHTPIRTIATACTVMFLAVASVLTHQQLRYWTDSVALWSRAVELDPRNDIALYNLATAFSEAGRRQDAIAMYERVLAVVPQQEDAKRNLVALKAADLEQRGNQLATEGRLLEAADQYAAALALDPKRVHAQAGRGMALLQAGHVAASITPLREAVRLGADDPAVPAALGAVLSDVGQHREARDVLRRALQRFPDNTAIAHNLARLLATSPLRDVRDPRTALALARRVNDALPQPDARALDTLAAAYAANGNYDRAVEIGERAGALAKERDPDLAEQILENVQDYRRKR